MQEAGMRMTVGEGKAKGLDLNFLLLVLSFEYVNIWSKEERSDLLARTEGEEYLRAIQIKNTQGF